jgi:hypothetical protein
MKKYIYLITIVLLALNISPASANFGDIKCQVGIPAAKATLAAARLSLSATEKALPSAQKKVKEYDVNIKKTKEQLTAYNLEYQKNPTTAQKEIITRTENKLKTMVAAQKSAAIILERSKVALPKSILAVKKAEAQLAKLEKDCK